VVFLVGLPLSIGIAIGSGVPAERAAAVGILTMAVGGIVGGLLGGSPLQVSGPAAGLIVIVQGIVQDVGWEGLYASLLIAGAVQVLSGIFRMGYLFQAITPGLLKGLLSAIGVLILTGQIYRVSGTTPPGEGYALGGLLNVVLIPTALWKSLANPNVLYAWGFVLLTLAVSYTWQRRAPAQWRFIPAPLLAVLISTLIALAWKPPLSYLQVPSNILAALHFFDAIRLSFSSIASCGFQVSS
jgi:MFS superfamily sulfate permease-like transporter